jgi:hypothetical protein
MVGGDDPPEAGRSGRVLVHVDRVVVVYGLDPVTDHGEVDRIRGPGHRTGGLAHEGLQALVEGAGLGRGFD